jgi:KaiC/GvpD/RAD55 family RecA-like ATPase
MLITGLPTGLRDLDFLTNGLHPGDLIVVAGNTGVGKTALALGIAQNVAIEEKKVAAIFSLEMNQESVISRFLCSEGHLDARRVASGYMSPDEWLRFTDAFTKLNEANLYINDYSFSMTTIKDKAQELYDEIGLDLIVIDYVQLVPIEHQPFGYRLSRELKQLAKDLAVPVIAVSQLMTTKIDKRIDKRPQLSDFGYDTSLLQDADLVIFLHREDIYNRTEENAGITQLIISKNRNGQTATSNIAFIKEFMRFDNLWREEIDKSDAPPDNDKLKKETQDMLVEIIKHSQDSLIQLTENRNISKEDCALSIFKSPQEQEFHKAVIEVFPGFSVYPNVALNCLFDFKKIKQQLIREEKNYFFKGIVDCVVFDEDNMPKYFFELDSSHHDIPEQQTKDTYKDNIFSKAGRKLYRIRKKANNLGQKEFEKLIREVLNKPK